jgi:hypothetical protein
MKKTIARSEKYVHPEGEGGLGRKIVMEMEGFKFFYES